MARSDDDDRYTENEPAPRRPRRRQPEPDYADDRPARPKSGGSKTIWLVLGLGGAFLLLLCCSGAGVGIYFGYIGMHGAADRAKSRNNLMQIGIAVHSYHDANNKMPPPYLKTKTGQPGLSWRVAILPYIEEDLLYRQFKLDEPWDSPNNIRLLNQMPRTYMIPGQTDPTVTHYRAFVGRDTLFDPAQPQIRFSGVRDGLTNTIMVIEANDSVPWTKPDDLPFPPKGSIAPLLKWRKDVTQILMGNASVRPLSKTVTETNLRNLITANDGMAVDLP